MGGLPVSSSPPGSSGTINQAASPVQTRGNADSLWGEMDMAEGNAHVAREHLKPGLRRPQAGIRELSDNIFVEDRRAGFHQELTASDGGGICEDGSPETGSMTGHGALAKRQSNKKHGSVAAATSRPRAPNSPNAQRLPDSPDAPISPGNVRVAEQAQGAQDEDALTHWRLELDCAWSSIPHPLKVHRGGEDVHIVCRAGGK